MVPGGGDRWSRSTYPYPRHSRKVGAVAALLRSSTVPEEPPPPPPLPRGDSHASGKESLWPLVEFELRFLSRPARGPVTTPANLAIDIKLCTADSWTREVHAGSKHVGPQV